MSNCTLIIGESGSGKSTSLRNLDPQETFIIGVLDKPLPFRGYKDKYIRVSKEIPTGNYSSCDDYFRLLKLIDAVNERRPEIKVLIIDDFQYLMANEFMRRALERGFDKFSEIAHHAWDMIRKLTETRSDLHCFVLSHSDTDASGKVKCKTIGKMLDDKVTLEGMFTTIFHTQVCDGQYKFLTQNDGVHIAKSPMDMFADKLIDNDLAAILEIMRAY